MGPLNPIGHMGVVVPIAHINVIHAANLVISMRPLNPIDTSNPVRPVSSMGPMNPFNMVWFGSIFEACWGAALMGAPTQAWFDFSYSRISLEMLLNNKVWDETKISPKSTLRQCTPRPPFRRFFASMALCSTPPGPCAPLLHCRMPWATCPAAYVRCLRTGPHGLDPKCGLGCVQDVSRMWPGRV